MNAKIEAQANEWAYQMMGPTPCEHCNHLFCMYYHNWVGDDKSDGMEYEPCRDFKEYFAQFESAKKIYLKNHNKY